MTASFSPQNALAGIEHLDRDVSSHFDRRLEINASLTRQLVSFQANKSKPVYRWYKYKEAFSASLIDHLIHRLGITSKILDPFAGSGTALFAASAAGLDADGIELLPIGQQIVKTKQILDCEFTAEDFDAIRQWSASRRWNESETRQALPELRITKGAYPIETREAIEKYLGALQRENERVRSVLRFALLCVLESVSFTRKDGQYLRWDHRSGRRQGSRPFDKGPILDFDRAITAKIDEIIFDLQNTTELTGLFPVETTQGKVQLFCGSCLDLMPGLADDTYSAIITSPPYCNRYDYTRTYALELALLGTGEKELTEMRQQMLSCTVENRAKDLLRMNPRWREAIAAADDQKLLQAILKYLEDQKAQGKLNNNGIPRMVRGYFYEMACVISECLRVMKPRAPLVMVNDNVRYAGASISVDLILSDIAERLGFVVEKIFVLPNGKGNSSQQMGAHGRDVLRKCVCILRKP
ncbi:MAG: site-specific DNA-methyltransferase [Acidobacteriota bacterium]